MRVRVVEGDLLEQDVDAIVNAWNRNLFPWWLLLPQGVSGAIKRRAGLAPFRELRKVGVLPLGGAVLTSAGRLPFKGIIHVAGIGLLWTASPRSVQLAVRNAIAIARDNGFKSVAFPLIGAGTGALRPDTAIELMLAVLDECDFAGEVRVIRYRECQAV
jgi:O-acetyl-ADP-ribose deacetylase